MRCVGVLALVALTVAAFLIREGRLTEAGSPEAGVFGGHLVGTGYLRLVMGLWGLQGLLLVAAAALLGGLDRLRGLLPALLAAMTGGAVAMASADLAVGAAAAAAGGVAALLVILAVEGPAAVAAGARELRVTLLGGAGLLCRHGGRAAGGPAGVHRRRARGRGTGRVRVRPPGWPRRRWGS